MSGVKKRTTELSPVTFGLIEECFAEVLVALPSVTCMRTFKTYKIGRKRSSEVNKETTTKRDLVELSRIDFVSSSSLHHLKSDFSSIHDVY